MKTVCPTLFQFTLGALFAMAAAPVPLLSRTFTDSQGKSIEAELVKVEGDQVTVRTQAGEFKLPLTRFSPEDQEFINKSKANNSSSNSAAAPHPAADVKPGATLTLDFPDLGPDRHGQPAQCKVSLPQNYDPSQKYPLVAWLGGGDGGNSPDRSFLPEGDFVAVGLPYPKGANNPNQDNMVGQFDKIWAYQRKMLGEVYTRVPNINKASSIIGGFSNGAHSIDGMLRQAKKDGLAEYFSAFILADGGGNASTGKGSYPTLRGKFVYVCWGEKSPNRPSSMTLPQQFKTHSAKVTSGEIKDSGHAFPESEKAKVKAWLAETVMPALLKGPG